MADSKQAGPMSLQELADEYRRLADQKRGREYDLRQAQIANENAATALGKLKGRLSECVVGNARRKVFALTNDARVLIVELVGIDQLDFSLEEIHRTTTP